MLCSLKESHLTVLSSDSKVETAVYYAKSSTTFNTTHQLSFFLPDLRFYRQTRKTKTSFWGQINSATEKVLLNRVHLGFHPQTRKLELRHSKDILL